MNDFDTIFDVASKKAKKLGHPYTELLEIERNEIEKQGAEQYWVDLIKSKTEFETNKNGLILPFLIDITPIDPVSEYGDSIMGRLEKKYSIGTDPGAFKDKDMPDIDLDFIPTARDIIMNYATDKYGADKVCLVGLWQTYHPRSALKDVAKSLGYKDKILEIEKMTKELPDEFDSANLSEALELYEEFKDWYRSDGNNKTVAEYAFRLVGKIKTQGKHAGGLIIANVPLAKYLPVAKIGAKGKEKWTSEWTEGTSVQLSKFGFVKYDILGLKTLQYIYETCQMIKRNYGIEIDWEEIGYEDEESYKTANELKTESIFQFDTDVAKGILSKGGVKKLTDILVYTSLGRPGPMPMVDEYIKRRDSDNDDWKSEEHPKVLELLEDTLGICVFQEQVSLLLTKLAGFTLPEADKARKIMSKKWKDQMVWVRDKILTGMGNSLQGGCHLPAPKIDTSDDERVQSAKEVDEICGTKEWTWAKEYWKRLETFARYSFNKAHAVSYCIQCYRCLYLKTHYPAEWWCAVLNSCKADKQPNYIRMAKSEGTQFGYLDVNNLSKMFDVINKEIVPGLTGIKGVGTKMLDKLDVGIHDISSIDDFVERQLNNKTLIERLIHLGAFNKMHQNKKATWYWYLYKYGNTDLAKQVRKMINKVFEPSEEEAEKIREEMYKEHKAKHPKSNKIPKRILNYKPKANPSREDIESHINEDYTLEELLEFQREFLGYHWDSPMGVYAYKSDRSIERSKKHGILECVISESEVRKTKKGNKFMTLTVTDGADVAKIQIWSSDIDKYGEEYFAVGEGLRLHVQYNKDYKSFNLAKNEKIDKLTKMTEVKKLSEYMEDTEISPGSLKEKEVLSELE
jgi:DNA polymerase III alpha subunit